LKEKKPAINVITKDQCTGCFGCYNSCPIDAIEMKYSEEGFFIPSISDKCNDCGICQQHCPVIQEADNSKKLKKPLFYGGKTTNKDIILNSSSGGIFPEIAKLILSDSGVVFGACLQKNLSLEHVKIETVEDLPKIMGSKYIQSDIGSSYKEVLKPLEKGRKVLFAGTPCQIAALNTFTDHENLYTIDLACHGVPSRILFDKYVKHMEEKRGKKVKNINFRDKEKGWLDYQVKITFTDDTDYRENHKFDPYFRLYLKDFCLMKSCYECEFNKIPRPGDISLGDFWGKPPSKIRDPNGVSVLFINNKKGKDLIKAIINSKKIEVSKTDLDSATISNPRMRGSKAKVPYNREQFLEDLKNQNFDYIKKNYIQSRYKLKFYSFIIKAIKPIKR